MPSSRTTLCRPLWLAFGKASLKSKASPAHRTGARAYAPGPWGMQPNTSLWLVSATPCAVSGPCLCCILYHIGGLRRITAANHCAPVSAVVVSIDLHSEKPCFSVQFVDTYSIHSFPPPSRRAQQIQGFQRSGAGVSHS